MQLVPHLFFAGRCQEAIDFYRTALDAQVSFIRYHKDSPRPEAIPAGWADKVMRASLTIGQTQLTLSDEPACLPLQGFALSIRQKDARQAARQFQALSEEGTVILPLQEGMDTEVFGILTDRFGVHWMFNNADTAFQ